MAVGSTGDELGDVMPRVAGMALDDPRPLATLLYEEVPDYSYIRGIPSQLGQFVCMTTGFRGSNVAAYGEVAAGGLGALALALRLLESGELDRVLVVGVAPPSSVTALHSFDRDEPLGTEAAPGAARSTRNGPDRCSARAPPPSCWSGPPRRTPRHPGRWPGCSPARRWSPPTGRARPAWRCGRRSAGPASGRTTGGRTARARRPPTGRSARPSCPRSAPCR